MKIGKEITIISLLLTILLVNQGTYGDVNTDNVANAINDFTLRLYKELSKTNDNLFSSGLSVTTVLNMLLTGAKTNTASELMSTLGYTSANLSQNQAQDSYHFILEGQRVKHDGYELDIGDSMWIQQGLNVLPEYKDAVKKLFFAEEKEVQFGSQETTDQINNWVKEATKGKIPKLFDNPLSSDVVMVLVNALYFKGLWKNKFDKELTEDYPFIFNKSTTSKKVRMMNVIHNFHYTESKDLNAHILELPYAGDEVSMIVLLPTAVDGLSTLEDTLTTENLNGALRFLNSESRIHVKLPKFSTSSSLPLSPTLKFLGVRSAFDRSSADFSGINGQNNLYVSNVIQKAIIELNEDGTVAAAATGGEMQATSVVIDRKEYFFTADHPFLYFIKHKPTNVILFMGKLKVP